MTAPTRWTWRETEDAEVEIVSNGTVSYRVMGGDGEALARALNEGERYKSELAQIAFRAGHYVSTFPQIARDASRVLEEAQ